MKKIVITLSLIAFGVSAYASAPKWCSSNKLSKTEKIICSDPLLQEADILLSKTYKKLMSYKGKAGHEGMWHRELKASQLNWLKKRNKLSDKSKIMDSYMNSMKLMYSGLEEQAKIEKSNSKKEDVTTYICGKKSFTVEFTKDRKAILKMGNRKATLSAVVSGSGFRYSDGVLTLSGKGDEASVEENGKALFHSCTVK
jgi:membrane-bound inhibitor of C-type lysozyme